MTEILRFPEPASFVLSGNHLYHGALAYPTSWHPGSQVYTGCDIVYPRDRNVVWLKEVPVDEVHGCWVEVADPRETEVVEK